MKPSEIITVDAKRNGVNPVPILNQLGRNLKSKNAILMQSGNTVLVVNKIGKGTAELHLYTADDRMADVEFHKVRHGAQRRDIPDIQPMTRVDTEARRACQLCGLREASEDG